MAQTPDDWHELVVRLFLGDLHGVNRFVEHTSCVRPLALFCSFLFGELLLDIRSGPCRICERTTIFRREHLGDGRHSVCTELVKRVIVHAFLLECPLDRRRCVRTNLRTGA